MNIALVTIHNANNYGAILQAYASQLSLSKYGKVTIINYNNRHISRSFDLIRFKPSFHGLMGTAKDLCRLLPRQRVIRKFKCFVSNNMQQTTAYQADSLMQGSEKKYDVYVAGSDQIWNPNCVSNNEAIDEIYFLQFAPESSKKISYASSFGNYKFSCNEEQLVKGYLSKFDSISVREKQSQIYLQSLLKKPVQHVLDPTLLLNKSEWLHAAGLDNVIAPYEKYILLYTVPKALLIDKVVKRFSKLLGIKVIAIDQGLSAGTKVDKQIRDAGPKEFLELFAHAEFIITDSFHGVCFSLDFERPFVAVSSGVHANRIESLLDLIGLDDRLIVNESQIKNITIESNYSNGYKALSQEREKSLDFIAKSLQ